MIRNILSDFNNDKNDFNHFRSTPKHARMLSEKFFLIHVFLLSRDMFWIS